MAKDPAVLFYTSDFLTGTAFFTMEQKGQYVTLLCEQHQLGSIPENHMINICKSYDNPVIKKFKKDEDGNYYNERMKIESEKRRMFCESRKNNKSGRRKKESYDITYDKSYDLHMNVHMENDNISIINKDNIINKDSKYVYSKFYDSEMEKSAKSNSGIYLHFVKFLFGENEVKRPLAKCLGMSDQISFESFNKLLAAYGKETIRVTILSLENNTKKYKSFNLTLQNWLKRAK